MELLEEGPTVDNPINLTSQINNTNATHLISNFDQIEEARQTCSEFKDGLLELMDYFDSLISQIISKGLTVCFSPDFSIDLYELRVEKIKENVEKVEKIIEGLAGGLSQQLNETYNQSLAFEREKDELSKSLKEIDLCYQKNKRRIERDLNKMEFKVKQVQDTREKMQIRHIKGLDIVKNEVNRIMPNSLTEK